MSDRLAAYRRAAVETAPPERLISMLLRRAIVEFKLAEEGLAAGGGGEDAFARLQLAQEILAALRGSLRRDVDDELPGRLDALYDFAYWRAVEARSRRDPDPCRQALAALEPIQAAWDEAFHA